MALLWLLAMASGLLLCCTHGFWPGLAVFAPVPLLWGLRFVAVRQAFYMGLGCGMCEAFVLAGMLHAHVAPLTMLVLFYGITRALFALSVCAVRRAGLWALPAQAACWVLLERLQAAVPYSLPTLLGDTQHQGYFLPLARVGGTYLVAFQIVWLAATLAWCLPTPGQPQAFKPQRPAYLLAWGLPLISWGLGILWPQAAVLSHHETTMIQVVQGGLPTWLYQKAQADPAWQDVPWQMYAQQTQQSEPASLTVWPETAVWFDAATVTEFTRRIQALAYHHGPMLVGMPRLDTAHDWYNSAILWQRGSPTQVVDKQRLALHMEQHFVPGHATQDLLHWQEGALGVVFCLESVVPQYAQRLAARGAQALLVLADGSRFGNTFVGRLHAQRTVLRAVETGLGVVHAGQQGFSYVVDPLGQTTTPLPAFTAGVLRAPLVLGQSTTPFVMYGDWLLLPEIALVLMAMFLTYCQKYGMQIGC